MLCCPSKNGKTRTGFVNRAQDRADHRINNIVMTSRQNGSAPFLVLTCAAAIKAAVMPVSLGSLLALWVGITDGRFLQAAYCPQEPYVMA